MIDQEALEMMQRCKHEIIILRQQIDYLRPKAEAYDNISSILSLLPPPSRTMGEDLIWTLDKRIQEINQKIKEKEVAK